jgi:acetyl-CoA C-acetyltransferase
VATDAARSCPLPERLEYWEEPAMDLAGRRALDLAGATPDDFAYVDLYSCFPSAVQIAAAAIGFGSPFSSGLDSERELTVTGGLTFAGGPFNSYVLHATATMMDRLRTEHGTRGFVSSVGGYMNKHAYGVYGSEPAEKGFVHECLDATSEVLPTRVACEDYSGAAVVETYAVMPAPGGEPGSLLFACRTDRDERTWATSPDPDLVAAVASEELLGRSGTVRDGVLHV